MEDDSLPRHLCIPSAFFCLYWNWYKCTAALSALSYSSEPTWREHRSTPPFISPCRQTNLSRLFVSHPFLQGVPTAWVVLYFCIFTTTVWGRLGSCKKILLLLLYPPMEHFPSIGLLCTHLYPLQGQHPGQTAFKLKWTSLALCLEEEGKEWRDKCNCMTLKQQVEGKYQISHYWPLLCVWRRWASFC